MKRILTAIAASLCAMPVLSAAPGDSPLGGGFMDDLITPYDDTAIELPGESARKPSYSRSTQLVDDSGKDTWGARDDNNSSATKSSSSKSSSSRSSSSSSSSSSSGGSSRSTSSGSGSGSSRSSSGSSSGRSTSGSSTRSTSGGSRSFNADGSYIPYSERYPEPEKEKSDSNFDRNSFDPNFNPFKNNYKYGDTNYNPNGTRPEYEETRRKIKDVLGEGVPKVIVDDKVEDLIHNPARTATQEAPTTPNRWTHAPNGWFCDYDDAMSKAQQSGKAVAVFFHSSDNDNSRKFKTERMENSKFKSKMRDRLLIVYLDYPDNADTSKDKRNKDQVAHNRRIAEKFHVSNYPTVIFLSSSGSELGRITESKTLTAFIENADRIVPQREVKTKNTGGFKVGGGIDGQGRQSSQSGQSSQGGQDAFGAQGVSFPQGGFPQGGFPQGGFPQGNFPQGGFGGMGN